MSKKRIITRMVECSKPTNTQNQLYQICLYKYPDRVKSIVSRFESYTGLPFDGESISAFSLTKFKSGCLMDMAQNSAATICAWVASSVRIYCNDNGINPEALCNTLIVKRVQGEYAYITEEEIQKVISFYEQCPVDSKKQLMMRAISAMAIIEYYTAARISDTEEFTIDNIKSQSYIDKSTLEQKLTQMICYTSKKTDVRASIPVKPIVTKILSDESIKNIKLTINQIDRQIKKIFKHIGLTRDVIEHKAGKDIKTTLDECVSSHLFRRSFATNLDRKGVNIETISRMMGHTNTQQTRRYIQGNTLVLDSGIINYFQ